MRSAPVDEEHAVAALEAGRGPLLGEEDRRASSQARSSSVSAPSGSSCEVGSSRRSSDGSRASTEGEAHSLELTGGERLGPAFGQPLGTHLGERGVHPRPDLAGSGPDVLEPEGDLVRDPAEDDLVLGILEERRDLAGEVGRAEAAGIEARDHDAALESPAVECGTSPASARRRVDLPEPDGPSSATTSPGSIWSETSDSAGCSEPGYE